MPAGVSVTVGGEALSDIHSRVASITIDRGRQDELDRTGTGRASIALNYVSGSISDFIGASASISLANPLGGGGVLFDGIVDEVIYDFDRSQKVTRASVECVDLLDYIASIELYPESGGSPAFGDPVPAGSEGNIFYEEETVQTRIEKALDEAGLVGAEIFTGNVRVRDTIYSPRTQLLTVIQDAADAEFPGVANFFVMRDGGIAFHGRLARFNPGDPQYHITTYTAGDGADSTRAQIRGLRMSRSRKHIINAALATPQGIADVDIEGQVVVDAASIASYGLRSWSAENLLTIYDLLNDLEANDATKLFATYYVDNYASPRTRIEELTFRSINPNHPRASATWGLMTTVDISDIINLSVSGSPGVAVAEDFFVEGLHYRIEPLNPDYADATLSLDLSPKAYWTSSPF